MQSETQQYDITAGAKEQRQQSLCSDKMVSSPGAIAEFGPTMHKSCLCIESLFLITSHISPWTHNLSVSVRVCCLRSSSSKKYVMDIISTLKLNIHEVHFLFNLPITPFNLYPTTNHHLKLIHIPKKSNKIQLRIYMISFTWTNINQCLHVIINRL